MHVTLKDYLPPDSKDLLEQLLQQPPRPWAQEPMKSKTIRYLHSCWCLLSTVVWRPLGQLIWQCIVIQSNVWLLIRGSQVTKQVLLRTNEEEEEAKGGGRRGEQSGEGRKGDRAWGGGGGGGGGVIQLGLLENPAVGRRTCSWLMGSAAVALWS